MMRGELVDLTYYKPTELECWLNNKYLENGIYRPSDMKIKRIAAIFGIEVHPFTGRCFADWHDNENGYFNAIIALNYMLDEETKRERFFHELCHPLKHVGSQNELPELAKQLQEIQASQFQLYAALPIYMIKEYIEQCSTIQILEKTLAAAFCLPESLVRRRLQQIENRIYWGRIEYLQKSPSPRIVITKEHVKRVQEEFGRKRQEKEEKERMMRNG
jgi:Zn-dependent peptidase ImmA (M78 family)